MDPVNWADLPDDLLDLILSKLMGKDRHSFSLVCKSWNSVAAVSPYRYSPCLLYYYLLTHSWKFYQYDSFSNMSFPELENAELHCSNYGWMLMSVNHANLFFFDPSNNRRIDLPCKAPHSRDHSLCFFSPPTSPECVVVSIENHINDSIGIHTLKRGEDIWQKKDYHHISDPDQEPFWMSRGAPVLHRGLIYLLSGWGDVATFDIEQQRVDFNFRCLQGLDDDMVIEEHHLVKVNGEDSLFGVFVFEEKKKVQVFRLSSDMKWDLVEDIGDKVLYLSHFFSVGDKARTKSLENCICFPMLRGDVAVFYSLTDKKYHSMDGDYLEGNAYKLKILEQASWIMPIPTQEVKTPSLSWL